MSRNSRVWPLFILFSLCLFLLAAAQAPARPPVAAFFAAESPSRPQAWAVRIERPGLPNLHKVNDGLYRGAQPTAEGIKELEKMGVRTIVNLRSSHSDKEILGGARLAYESIPINTWDMKEADAVRFLRIVNNPTSRPVFVHCQHGADRTGTMCAAYRAVVDGWTKRQAIDEMTRGGFGFHPLWVNLPKFVENLNVEQLRSQTRPTKR